MKATHKFQALKADVGPVLASSKSVSEAARRLGISRATLHDWIKAGKVKKPSGRKPSAVAVAPKPGQSAAAWARGVRRAYELSGADELLLRLAVRAYKIATSNTAPLQVQLSAQGRFAALVKQLDLEEYHHGEIEDAPAPAPTPLTWPRRVGG